MYSQYFMAGLLFLTVSTCVAFLIVSNKEKFSPIFFIQMSPIVISVAIAISVWGLNRDLGGLFLLDLLDDGQVLPAISDWTLRLANWYIVLTGVVVILSRERLYNGVRDYFSAAIIISFLVFYIFNHILNGVFGEKQYFSINSTYPIFYFYGVYVATSYLRLADWLKAVQTSFRIIIAASIFLAVYSPNSAFQDGYSGFLPLFDFRFWGVASHANALGAAMGFYLILDHLNKDESLTNKWFWKILALILLILSQSKTSIAACFISLAVIFLNSDRSYVAGLNFKFITKILLMILPAIFWILSNLSFDSSLQNTLLVSNVDIETGTGRDQIWAVAVQEWLSNPFFGYGPTIWNVDYRYLIGMNFAVSAHNQLLHSLSAAGSFGGLSFLAMLFVFFIVAARTLKPSNSISMAMVIYVAIRGLSESSFQLGLLVIDGLIFVSMFGFLLFFLRENADGK